MKKRYLLTAILFAAFATPALATPNLLTNGSFEDRVITAADNCAGNPWCVRNTASTSGWTQFGDGVDLINNNFTQSPPVLVKAYDGVNFLDMNQAGLLGGLYQIVNATAGELYHLSLESVAWATNSIGGTLGYQLYDPASGTVLASGSFTDPTGGAWVTLTLDADAISSSIGVRIQGLAATQAGMGLDDVVLTAVPEPGTITLMLAGLGLTGWLVRRRRRTAHDRLIVLPMIE